MTPTDHISKDRLYFLLLRTSGAKYAGVPTTDRLKDSLPIILANPKSHNFICHLMRKN